MRDYFEREVEIGDTIVWMQSDTKWFSEATVTGFGRQFGKPYIQTNADYKSRVQSDFIIIKKIDGELEWIGTKNR